MVLNYVWSMATTLKQSYEMVLEGPFGSCFVAAAENPVKNWRSFHVLSISGGLHSIDKLCRTLSEAFPQERPWSEKRDPGLEEKTGFTLLPAAAGKVPVGPPSAWRRSCWSPGNTSRKKLSTHYSSHDIWAVAMTPMTVMQLVSTQKRFETVSPKQPITIFGFACNIEEYFESST